MSRSFEDRGGRSPLIIKDLDLYPQPPLNTRSPTLNSEEPEFPADWTADDILQAGAQVLREKGIREGVNVASATGRVNGVTIRVAYRNDAKGYRVKSIIPVEK